MSTTPLRLVAALAAVAPGAAVATGIAWYSRYSETTPAPPRVSGGAIAAVALGGAIVAALVVWRVRLPAGAVTSRNVRRLALVAVVVVALGGAAAVAHSGATEPRASYFHVAWHDEYLKHPLLGTGAGTFGGYWLRFGKPLQYGGALDTHSLYLETLAELGPVGLLLLLAMLLAPLRGATGRRHAPYLPAALGAYAAFLVHAGLDWDWEMPAVVVAALCCAGAVAAAELEEEPPLGARARAAVVVVALVLGGCAIAGARSTTVPEAAPKTQKAPLGGAFDETRAWQVAYLP
jgi:O-antigen ligase/polysaccharide polymerase Wzy-like membrane protein